MQNFHNIDLNVLKGDISSFIQSNATLLKDYNFEGGALSELVGILAYNTQNQLFYLNNVASELILSTANITDNVYRVANMLNYIPKRNVSPSIDTIVTNITSSDEVIQTGYQYTYNDISLVYVGEGIIVPANNSVTVSFYQGTYKIDYHVSDGSANQLYELSEREKVSNNRFLVYVDNVLWESANNTNPSANGNFYYIDYSDKFRVKFDSGDLFSIPQSGSDIRIEYLINDGDTYNNSIFSGVTIYENSAISVYSVSSLTGGFPYETISDIATRAPLFYTTVNRAVTENDYNTLIKQYTDYNSYLGFNLWGGEKEKYSVTTTTLANTTYYNESGVPDVGYIYYSGIKNTETVGIYDYIDSTDITNITEFLSNYKIITLLFKYVPPTIINVTPNINIKLSKTYTDKTLLQSKIDDFFYTTYNGFDKELKISSAIRYIADLPEVDYTTISFNTSLTVNKENFTRRKIDLTSSFDSVYGCVLDIGIIGTTLSVNDTIETSTGTYKIIDTNFHTIGSTCYVSIDPITNSTSIVSSTNTPVTLTSGTNITTSTLYHINYITSSGSNIFNYYDSNSVNSTIGYIYNNTDIYLTTLSVGSFSNINKFTLNINFGNVPLFTASKDDMFNVSPAVYTYL